MYLPDVPTTKILTIETLTSARDQVRPVMSDGVARTVALYLGGKIDQWFARQDKPGVFILNMSSVEDARLMPDGLPLGLKDMMSFELIPPGPLKQLFVLMAVAKGEIIWMPVKPIKP